MKIMIGGAPNVIFGMIATEHGTVTKFGLKKAVIATHELMPVFVLIVAP